VIGLGNGFRFWMLADGAIQQAAAVFQLLFPAHSAGSNELMENITGRFPVQMRYVPVQRGQSGGQQDFPARCCPGE